MRCEWADNDRERDYHDLEWGVPIHDDNRLFEYLTLEGAQAGLSWSTILAKREGYRTAFHGFDPIQTSKITASRIDELVLDPTIVRHRGKIESTVSNAQAILEVAANDGSFDSFIWAFVGGKPITRDPVPDPVLPSSTPLATAMSKALKKRGFKFVGPTTCYAFMQAAGLVNDHHPECFRYAEVAEMA